jgi:hypothetical protein
MALNELPALNEIDIKLNQADIECFADVRDVLARHGRLDRFGMTLLHRHFDVADDERLIETIDVAERVQTISVHKTESLSGVETIETAWRLRPEGIQSMAECIIACHGPNTKYCTESKHTGQKTGDDDDD